MTSLESLKIYGLKSDNKSGLSRGFLPTVIITLAFLLQAVKFFIKMSGCVVGSWGKKAENQLQAAVSIFLLLSFFAVFGQSLPPVKLPRCNSQPVIWTTSNLTSRKLLLTVITEIPKYPACLGFTLLTTACRQRTRTKQSGRVKLRTPEKQKAGQI